MQIEIIRSVEDAHTAKGLAVVIDVFRAFSVEAYIFANGAAKIIPVLNLEEAYKLKEENPEYILIGERGGIKPEGFDFGNSPTEILDTDFSGKTIVHTTSNGTKGLVNTINAEAVLAGGFVMADSILAYIKQNNFQNISLISTAPDTGVDNEDLLFAYYIRDVLEGVPVTESDIKSMTTKTSAYALLFDEVGVPATDFDLCLDFNRFNFIIKKVMINNQMCLVREDIIR
jgi:2-phosphosulfolactate phosphatase